jgi:hypothetical protein
MFPLNPSSLSMRDTGGIDRAPKKFELHDVNVAELRSFSIADSVAPRLRPGNQVHLVSGESSVYRRVEQVETISGGYTLIWLEPGHVTATEIAGARKRL